MAINWKYIKGMTNNCTSWIEFSNTEYNDKSTRTTDYAPEIKYYNTDNYESTKSLGKIITSQATGQTIDNDFSIKGKLDCNSDLTCSGNIKFIYKNNNKISLYSNDTTESASIQYNSECFAFNFL